MGIWEYILNKLTYNIGIDLGTSTTLVSIEKIGIVTKEPSVVAINKKNNQILAVGEEAKRMVGRTPGDIVAIRPLRNGVITDFEMTEAMLKYFVDIAHDRARQKSNTIAASFMILRPRVVVGVPSGITEVERRAVVDAAERAGAREVYIIEEPMAAAIGAGLAIENPSGTMIVDIGGGTSDIAIISLGSVVVDNTIRLAGDAIDAEIIHHAKNKWGLQIGDRTAEDLKIAVGDLLIHENKRNNQSIIENKSVLEKDLKKMKEDEEIKIERKRVEIEVLKSKEISKQLGKNGNFKITDSLAKINQSELSDKVRRRLEELDNELVNMVKQFSEKEEEIERELNKSDEFVEPTMEIRGRDIKTGLPKSLMISSSDVYDPIAKVIDEIIDATRGAIDQAPPEILGDLLKNGITLTGGGALIRNIDKYFEQRIGTPVKICDDPVSAVVRGCTAVLQEIELLKRIQKDD